MTNAFWVLSDPDGTGGTVHGPFSTPEQASMMARLRRWPAPDVRPFADLPAAWRAALTQGAHSVVDCVKDVRSSQFHTKSWSYQFDCPVCRNWKRQNTNYLGSRFKLVCDGETIRRVPK